MGCKNMGATYFQGDRDATGALLESRSPSTNTSSPSAPQGPPSGAGGPPPQPLQRPSHHHHHPPPLPPPSYHPTPHYYPHHHYHHPPPPPPQPTSHHHPVPSAPGAGGGTGEPWLAAQNLTFLKRGSPSSENAGTPQSDSKSKHQKKRAFDQANDDSHPPEIASMPSLASSSEGTIGTTSPGGELSRKRPKDEEPESATKQGAGVSSLLMAAMAMTEFAGDSSKPAASATEKSSEDKTKKRGNTKSKAASTANGYSPPRRSSRASVASTPPK